ncbi:MAG: hypothetical protein QXO72_04055 [Sulfolobales archaeon]
MGRMSDAASYFLRGFKELKLAEELASTGNTSESLRRYRLSFTNLAKSYLLLNNKPLIGISNPHYLASILYDLGHENVFKLVSSAEIEGSKNEEEAIKLYSRACQELLNLIRYRDAYLDTRNKTYLF